jgi:predicted small secreted protein
MRTDQITRLQRIVLSLLITVLLAIVGVGCNTANGFGKDVKNAGESIENGSK